MFGMAMAGTAVGLCSEMATGLVALTVVIRSAALMAVSAPAAVHLYRRKVLR